MTTCDPSHITELMLRRYRAGELDPQTHGRVEDALGASSQLRSKLQALVDEQDAFENEIPFQRFVGGVQRAQKQLRRPRRAWLYPSGAALAMAAAALMLLVRPHDDKAQTTFSNRSKGDGDAVAAFVHVAGASVASRVSEAGVPVFLQPGDRVRLELRRQSLPPAAYHFVVVSLDGEGEATALYPEEGGSLAWPQALSSYLLPDALAFDGEGRETLFVALSPQPFAVKTVQEGLRRAWRKHAGLDAISAKDLPTIGDVTLLGFPFHKP